MGMTSVHVITVHDKNNSVLTFDLKEIIRALNDYLDKWTWCVTSLECLGKDSELVSRALTASPAGGVWMSSREMAALAADITQTIDGCFLAFPRDIDRQTVQSADLDLEEFPSRPAELAIRAVDSSFFEIFAKDPDILHLLRQSFQDVHLEDPVVYFADI